MHVAETQTWIMMGGQNSPTCNCCYKEDPPDIVVLTTGSCRMCAMLRRHAEGQWPLSSLCLFLSITINNLVHRSPSIGCWPAATPSACARRLVPFSPVFAILGFAMFSTPPADQPADDPFISAASFDYTNRWPWPYMINITMNSW